MKKPKIKIDFQYDGSGFNAAVIVKIDNFKCERGISEVHFDDNSYSCTLSITAPKDNFLVTTSKFKNERNKK